MSSDLFFRVSVDPLPVGLFAYLREHGLLFLVKEFGKEGDHPHYQGIIVTNKTSLRKHFQRLFVGIQKAFSLKETDNVSKTVQYLCKEIDTVGEIIYNEGFDTKALAEAYHEENARLKSGKRKRGANLSEECWLAIESNLGDTLSGNAIAQEILRWHDENARTFPNGFRMLTLVQTYIYRQNKRICGFEKISDSDMVRRLYPGIDFLN